MPSPARQRSLSSNIRPNLDWAGHILPPLANLKEIPSHVRSNTSNTSGDCAKSTSWSTAEVGYFDPDLTEANHIRYVKGVMYFSHVLAFVNNIRAISVFMREDIVGTNLHACLRGLAREWFISELSHTDRLSLRDLSLEDGWFKRLLDRFTPSEFTALAEVHGNVHLFEECPSYPNPISWSHSVLRRLQCDAKYTRATKHEQLVTLYGLLDPSLHRRLAPPVQGATIAEFIKALDDTYTELYYEDSSKRVDLATKARKSPIWIPSEIGYFTPDQTLTRHVHRENGILYFQDVYAFVNYLRVIAETTQEESIQTNLHLCLRDKALEWWVAELSSQDRQNLRTKSLEDGWFHVLQSRFQPIEEVADEQLYETKYGWDAVKAEYPAVVWAHTMLRHHQAMRPARIFAELSSIWNAIDPELQRDMKRPTESTSLAEFMASIDRCYNKWRWFVMTERK